LTVDRGIILLVSPISQYGSVKGERAKGKGERGKGKGQRAKGKGQRAKGKGQRFQIHPLPFTP